jgi:hypothetical protein
VTLLHPRVDRAFAGEPETEALIREARRLRRRRCIICVLVVLAVGASGLGLTLGSSGGPPATPSSGAVSGSSSTTPVVTARWSDLTTSVQGIAPGAQVTTVIRYHGEFIAAGNWFGPGPGLAHLDCPSGCNPVVWTSTTGASWKVSFASNASGSVAGEQLLATPVGLLLFNADEGTSLWRSLNGITWRQAILPAGMSATGLTAVAWGHGRVVAAFYNKYAPGPVTAYGEADNIWTSTNGTSWHHDVVPNAPLLSSLAVMPTGFVAGGTSRTTGRAIIWRSANGLAWTASPFGAQHGVVYVAANANSLAVEDLSSLSTGREVVQVWWSNGTSLRQATVNGLISAPAGPDGPIQPVIATPDGFLIWGDTPTKLWWSADGRTWSVILAVGNPSATYETQEVLSDGGGLLALETATRTISGVPDGTTSLWQVGLSKAG